MTKSNRRPLLALALTSFALARAGACLALSETDLSVAPPCKAAPPAATAEVMRVFEQRYGEANGTNWIDVNGDGLCDLVIGHQPTDPERRTISVFFVVPGTPGGGLAQNLRWRSAGGGVSPEAVRVKGSPLPYLVTRTRDGYRHVLRWNPNADMSARSPFRELGLRNGALLELDDDDRDVGIVRRFLSRRYVAEGVQQARGEKYAAAVAALNEAGNIDPRGAEINHHLGVVKSMAGADADTKHERGAAWYLSRALKQGIADPNSAQYNRSLAADTNLRLAQSYEATRDARAAASAYKRYMALEPSAKRAQIENRIKVLESAKPVFQAPRLSPRMAEEARKTVRFHAPTPPAAAPSPATPTTAAAAIKLQALVRPPAAPAAAAQPSPRTAVATAPQAVKPPEKLVRPPAAPAAAAQPSPRTAVATAPQAVKPPEKLVRPPAAPAAAAQPSPRTAVATAPQAVKPPEKLVRPPVAPAAAAQPSPRTAVATAPQAVKPPEAPARPPVAPAPAAQPSPRTAIAAAPQAVKPPPAPAAAAPDKETAVRRDLAAESEKQKRKLTPGEIDNLVRYKLAHAEARIQDLVANPGAYAPKPPAATRPAPTLRTQ